MVPQQKFVRVPQTITVSLSKFFRILSSGVSKNAPYDGFRITISPLRGLSSRQIDLSISEMCGIVRDFPSVTVTHEGARFWSVETRMRPRVDCKDDWDLPPLAVVDEASHPLNYPSCLRNPKWCPARLDEFILHINNEQSCFFWANVEGRIFEICGSR